MSRELADLRTTPDDAGRTWEQVQREGVRMEFGARSIDDTESIAFRNRTVPGTSETFDQAEKRVMSAAQRRLGEALTHEGVEVGALDGIRLEELWGPRPPVDDIWQKLASGRRGAVVDSSSERPH